MTNTAINQMLQYDRAYNKAISMCPSGIVSWALDEVGSVVGGNPHPEEVQAAVDFLEEQIEMAIEEGDYNRAMDNAWDPSVFRTS